ncbi:MAG TPA: M28 family peptidase, partial [Bryobacteraceae bacterium]|nr:M28 family peptidase [Bryobacteraceae bacterium]
MRAWCKSLSSFLIPMGMLVAQDEPNPKTLIPQKVLESIADEVSGTLSYQHILELAGYEHDRYADEYKTTYREAAYIERMAKQYGLEDVHIERFKLSSKTWDGERGELWLLNKDNSKRLVMSYRDVAASLAPGSKTSDVTAEMVWVGKGTDKKDYVDKNVAGKVVLASGAVGRVHNLAVREFGAAGVVSFANDTGKPIDHPDEIAWSNLAGGRGGAAAGQKTTFGIILSHRLGTELADRLQQNEQLNVRVVVQATEYDAEMQVPTAVIKGTGESTQEVAMTGHLFEGIAKQGALDDASGSATALEVARAWKKLIDDGVLPRPKRTVRFMWVPEIQGTTAYLERYPEEAKQMVAAISMDMVGEDVTKNHNSLHLMRTPYAVNSFINEVPQQFFEYVGDTNREKVQNRRVAYSFRYPIIDPQGTHDPFYFNIDKHYGSSDHSAFLRFGIPAVLLNNWPDVGYHTSEDRAFNADPTQLKRAAFIGVATMSTMANAWGTGAVRVAELTAGNAAQRAGVQFGLAMQMLSETGDDSWAQARNLVVQSYQRENAAIRSAAELAGDGPTGAKIEAMARTFAESGQAADLARLRQYAGTLGVPVTENALTPVEVRASKLVPVRKKPAPAGGGGANAAQMDPADASRQQYNAMEMRGFADGKRSILDIRNALSAEYGPQDVARVIAFFEGTAKAGEFELVE